VGGKYIVCTFNGFKDDIRIAYQYMYTSWIPENGYLLDDNCPFGVYNEKEKKDNGKIIYSINIYIPVKPM